MSMEMLGWISGILLAFCSVPEAIRAHQFGFCGLTDSSLWMWAFGELLGLIYVCSLASWPLIASYSVSLAATGWMMYFRYWPRTSVRDFVEEADQGDL